MPAGIARINSKEAMAYVNAMPWHGLGTEMPANPDVAAALKAGALDWTVELCPVFTTPPGYQSGDYTRIPKKSAVVRDVDGVTLGIVGGQYQPVQNAEAFGILNVACAELGVTIETAGALGNGERVWMLAKMPTSIEPIDGDRIDGYFLVVTGHDGKTPVTARSTPIRVVCSNTLHAAMRSGAAHQVRATHNSKAYAQLAEAEALVNNLAEDLTGMKDVYQRMASKKMTLNQVNVYVERVMMLPPGQEIKGVAERRKENLIDLAFNGKGADVAGATAKHTTAWQAFNAVAEYVDHVKPAEGKNLKSQRRLAASALFGPMAQMKTRAFNLARELVKA